MQVSSGRVSTRDWLVAELRNRVVVGAKFACNVNSWTQCQSADCWGRRAERSGIVWFGVLVNPETGGLGPGSWSFGVPENARLGQDSGSDQPNFGSALRTAKLGFLPDTAPPASSDLDWGG